MLDFNTQSNYPGPTTTMNSASEGRLKVDVNHKKKRKILKKYLRR